jgi:hypothetical protein
MKNQINIESLSHQNSLTNFPDITNLELGNYLAKFSESSPDD